MPLRLQQKPSVAQVSASCRQRFTAVRVAAASNNQQVPVQWNGKAAFITGANTGIGYETAKALCKQGYLVTMGCRDGTKALMAAAKITEEVPGATIKYERLDLSDLTSVRDCVKRVADGNVEYDIWINNAGVMYCPLMTTKDGFEYQLGVNHFGHFALTTEVLPVLAAAAKPVRIVNVASAAHVAGKLDFEDLFWEKTPYDPWKAYGRSKLANIVFTYELARRLGDNSLITANCLHPGVVKTELGRFMLEDGKNKWYFPMAMAVMKAFMKEPADGARTSIHLATHPSLEGVTGKYFADCRRTTSSVESYDPLVGEALWGISEELTSGRHSVQSHSPVLTLSEAGRGGGAEYRQQGQQA